MKVPSEKLCEYTCECKFPSITGIVKIVCASKENPRNHHHHNYPALPTPPKKNPQTHTSIISLLAVIKL